MIQPTHRDGKVKTLVRPEKSKNDMTRLKRETQRDRERVVTATPHPTEFYGISVFPYSKPSEFHMTVSLRLTPIVLVLLIFLLGAGNAQADAVCSDTPAAGDRIECTEDATSTGNIVLTPSNLTITTTVAGEHGVYALHEGSGEIDIDLTGVTIDTGGVTAHGIQAEQRGTGDIDIFISDGSVTTRGLLAHGIFGQHDDNDSGGDVIIKTRNATILTESTALHPTDQDTFAVGIYGWQRGPGNVDIEVQGGSIETRGTESYGVVGFVGWIGDGEKEGGSDGDIDIFISDGSVTTQGLSAHAILGRHDDNASGGDVIIRTRNAIILTESTALHPTEQETFAVGILAWQRGPGNVDIDIQGGSIETRGTESYGVFGNADHGGELLIRTGGGNTITTLGPGSHGIYGRHQGTGDIDIFASDGSVTTQGLSAHAILGWHDDNASGGDVIIKTRDYDVLTEGPGTGGFSYGVIAYQQGPGNIDIDFQGGSVTTKGISNHGFVGWIVDGEIEGGSDGDIDIFISDGSVTTQGLSAHGIIGRHDDNASGGDVIIRTRNATILTESTALHSTYDNTFAVGIFGYQIGPGNADIDLQGGSVETRGTYSYGVYGVLENADHGGELLIRTRGGNTITTEGPNGHGIVAYNYGTLDTSTISVDVGGSVTTTGQNSQGVRVGTVTSGAGEPDRVAAIGSDGYRQQTVTVNGSVMGSAAGVFLAGGGRVVIGPRGSIGAESGIAILATGDTLGANPGDPVIKPKLRVDMNLGGRKVEQALGENWIINDGGETTIAVNGVLLHDGETGVTDLTAANGAWDVSMAGPGVRVMNSTDPDPANWITETSATPADRDFSAAEPEREPEPEAPMFMEEYAPRAALYEVLPDFMLRMQKWEPTRQRLFLPESPVYIRLLGSTGSQEFKHSTVNANYDADRFAVEAGVNIPLFENLDIWTSMHHVTGSADVDSPVDGGDIRVTGAGLSVDAYWSSEDDYYATGRLSLTDYDIDLSSNERGRLKSNGDANGQSVHVEAGRRMTLNENLHWTPRAWLGHTRISVDKFTDAVDSRVSFSNTDRFTGGLGVMAESVRTEYGGELLLRGSLDFEQKFGDSKTVTLVSGERLSAEPEKSSALLSLSGTWNKGPFKFSAELSARQDFNSGGEDYSGMINVGMNF